jgi:SAM-dependent methyltransferase
MGRQTIEENVERFSRVADDYARYRPRYSPGLIDFLHRTCGLGLEHVIADIGCGTGLLSEHFLENGNRVFGVEPNDAMRTYAEKRLGANPLFRSVVGTAEATTLADKSVDFISVGQAFHWFNPEPTRQEFERILKPDGWVVLVWNFIQYDASPFLEVFKGFWQRYFDPRPIPEKPKRPAYITRFFGERNIWEEGLENVQVCDYGTLRGRMLSSSVSPKPEDADYGDMLAALREIFGRHQEDGQVTMVYSTRVVCGRLVGDGW